MRLSCYTKICKYCFREFESKAHNAICCLDCKKEQWRESAKRYYEKHKVELAEKRKIKYYANHELSKKRGSDAQKKRWAKLHPHVDRYCPDCGALLQDVRAQRCKSCAEEHHRAYMREFQAKKRAERMVVRKKQAEILRQEKKTMDESVARAKKASVKVSKMHKAMERDARAQERAEQKRIAASVALLKKIHAKHQREKRDEEEFFKSIR